MVCLINPADNRHTALVDFTRNNPGAGTDPALTTQLTALANAAGGDNTKVANVCANTCLCGNVTSIIGGGRLGGGTLTEEDWSPELTLSWDYSSPASDFWHRRGPCSLP